MKKKLFVLLSLLTLSVFVVSCGDDEAKSNETKTQATNTAEKTDLLSAHNWQGTKAYNDVGDDLTEEFGGFISYAKYDANTNQYEFFDKATGKGKDAGIYFLTGNGKKRILLSETNNYNAIVDITELTNDIFTYKRSVSQDGGEMVDVLVDHVPFNEELTFTNELPTYSKTTGTIDLATDGATILANTNWQGTYAYDENGNDVSEFNSNYLGLAKYDDETNVYEFFKKNGEPRGDYGYYDVIRNNKVRVHYSVGFNYRAILELTELNDGKFTYARMGKDKDGNDIMITVEHVPYDGELEFSDAGKSLQ